MTDYQAFEENVEERMEDIEEGTAIEHSRCIICLSDADFENGDVETGNVDVEVETGNVNVEKSNTPLMNILTLCGNDRVRDNICNCRYNIHTSCFVETNKVFNNVCVRCVVKIGGVKKVMI